MCLTDSNIIKKAQVSADVQLCRNLNTVLANAEAEGRVPSSMYEVLYLENEAGYIIENLNPTADDMYFAWDQEENQMIYLMSDLETVYYPEDYTLKPGSCWITVGDAVEAAKVGNMGYNLALENDFTDDITLTSTVSIDTLGYKCSGSVTMGDGAKSVETCYLIGQFGTTNITASATSVQAKGSVSSLSVAKASSVSISGSVGSYTAAAGVSSTVNSTGQIKTVASTNSATITNNGVIKESKSTATSIKGTKVGESSGNVEASTRSDLDSIRTQIVSGSRNFEGETVSLANDIDLAGIAFTPIANISRSSFTAQAAFSGTFDGANHTIKNFTTSGFTITGLNAGTNTSTPYFTEAFIQYNEAVYGLFGVTYNAVIKNVTVTCDINLVLDSGNHYVGDSVGGIVGCAFGTIEFINCTVDGTIKGYDGVGGLLGRLKGTSATFTNCTNNADVTGVRKTGGFIGSSYTGDYTVTYNNCVNNGDITCLGRVKDLELGVCKEATQILETLETIAADLSGYYTASASNGEYLSASYVTNTGVYKNKVVVNGFTNNGTIKVGSVDVGDGTYYDTTAKKMTYK